MEERAGIAYYAVNFAGRSHIDKGEGGQDSCVVVPLDNGVVLAACADGVGSAKCSAVGSRMACDALGAYAALFIREYSFEEVLRGGFEYAAQCIATQASNDGREIYDYDTTLTAVLWDGIHGSYGHSGDGGIISLGGDGRYSLITKVQKGEAYNEVFPLRCRQKWVFGELGECAALALMTDGVLDIAVPPLLSMAQEHIYTAFVRRLLPAQALGMEGADTARLGGEVEEFLRSEECAALSDDVTVVALFSDELIEQPEEEYFSEPDWAKLRQERYYLLYPHLRPRTSEGSEPDEGI